MRNIGYFLLLIPLSLIFFSCKKEKESNENTTPKVYTRFRGNYNTFNDLPELHMQAALTKGIISMKHRHDTIEHAEQIKHLPEELNFYKIDKLTYSAPYLVNDAAALLMRIGKNFQDSLRSKRLAQYKLVVTSLIRTDEDVDAITKKNRNAVENSAHCYGTTMDISWKRFIKIGPSGQNDVNTDKLKLILAEVLHDLRERDLCYIKHERKQACFHITVR